MLQDQAGQPKGRRFKRTAVAAQKQLHERDDSVDYIEDEQELRARVADILRVAASVTYYLRSPSFSQTDINSTRTAVIAQAKGLKSLLGCEAVNRVTVHQTLHMADSILDYGKITPTDHAFLYFCAHMYMYIFKIYM